MISIKTGAMPILLAMLMGAAGAAEARRGGLDCQEADLSRDQKAAIKTIWRDFKAAAEGQTKEERRRLRAEARQSILDTVPSSEAQRTALAACQQRRGQRGCPAAHLSEEQKTAIKALRRDFKAAAEGQTKKERRRLRAEARQEIEQNVLISDEQRAAFAECREQRRSRRRGQRP